MARRRSLNRRGSRRSFNVTDLDQNSELVDSRDPLWWKNIEGDMTVAQSRFSYPGNMTGPILNNDSAVSAAELNNEWWKSLDNTATNSPRRTSPRKSVRSTKTPSDSFISEASDESSIKKRKVAIQARDKKNVGTDNFLAVLNDPNVPPGGNKKSRGRNEDAEASPRRSNRQGKNAGDSEADTTVNTSNEADVILKSRPKPFKKRFTKVSSDVFNNAETPGAKNSPENQRNDESVENSLFMEKSPSELNNVRDSQLMRPPKTASHQKRLSSVSRRINLSSEESESDGGKRKQRLGFRRKTRKGVSINPFDKLIGADLEARDIASSQGEIDTGQEDSTPLNSRRTNSGDENSRVQNPLTTPEINNKTRNRSAITESHKNPVEKSLDRENSQSQQIDDASDDDGVNLEKSLDRERREGGQTLEKRADRKSRSVRTSKRVDDKSTYDLPPQERSTTPVISDSDGEEEKEFSSGAAAERASRISSRSNRSRIQNLRPEEAPEISLQSKSNTSRKVRGNNSRTRIFSDEDISIEGTSDTEQNGNLTHRDKRDVGKSRKSLAANKSRGIGPAADGGIETEDRGASISESIHLRPQEYVRRSPESRPRSITGIISVNKIQQNEKFDASPAGLETAIVDQSISATLRAFRKSSFNRSITSNLHVKTPELGEIDENAHEPENESQSESRETTRRSRKSIANQTRTKTLNEKLAEPDESDDEREISQEPENLGIEENDLNLRSKENARASGKIAANKSRRNDQNTKNLEPEVSEDEEESSQQIRKSRLHEKTKNKSRRNEENAESLEPEVSEDEKESSQQIRKSRLHERTKNKSRRNEENAESLEPEVSEDEEESSQQIRKSRLHERTKNKSRRNEENAENLEPEVSEDEEESSQQIRKSRLHEKAKNSQASVETSEEEEPRNVTNNSKSNLRLSRKNLASFDRSRRSVRLSQDFDEDEPESAKETSAISSSSRLEEKSRNSRKSLAKRKQSFSDDEESSAGENPKEKHRKSEVSRVEKKSVKTRKSILKRASKTIEPDVNTSDAETEKNYEIPQIPRLDKNPRRSTKNFGTNESRRVLFEEDDSEEETDVVPDPGSTSINRSPEIPQSSRIASEDELETVRKSDSHLRKSRGARKSFPQMEKILENEAENSHELVITPKPRNSVRRGASQQSFDVDEMVDDPPEENEENRGRSMGKKSINNAAPSKDFSATPVTKSIRETLLTKKQNAKSVSDLNSSTFRPLAASLASTQHSTPLRVQKNITDFFSSKFLQKSNNPPREVKTTFDKEKLKELKEKLKDEMKNREAHSMQKEAEVKKKEISLKKRLVDSAKQKKIATGEPTATTKKNKVIDKAFIVNGVVYKQPKLPRPKPWVTDRLYRHLWKLMEPKYRLSTRIKSEQFIQDLAKTVVLITRRAKYESYKHELNALMKNMATLGIIKTRNDFYDFCYDFLPYDFRVKVTPIMMPGNVLTIPYDPAKLHTPLLRET